jgi:hypothetical protein
MNDTETEARRLLTAGTEDLPAEIGLLDGFVAARQRGRDRARRVRRGAALSGGIAVAVAAVTAVTLTIGSAPPALAAVTGALTRTLGQSYHVTEQVNSHYVVKGRTRYPARLTCTGEEDPVRHLVEFSCSNGFGGREVGGYTYQYFPYFIAHSGKHWESAPLRAQLPGWFANVSPEQILAEIKQANKVTVVGPVSGPGWTGTRYAITGPQSPSLSISGTVDVDSQGRARKFVLTMGGTATVTKVFSVNTVTLTFSDFGAPVKVTPPPADQVFPYPSSAP